MVRPAAFTTVYFASLSSSVLRLCQLLATPQQQGLPIQARRWNNYRPRFGSFVASFIIATTTTLYRPSRVEALDVPLPEQSTTRKMMMISSFASVGNHPVDIKEDYRTTTTKQKITTGYLNAADAAALDVELMSTPGYTLEQLMELAGLAVAEAVYQVITSSSSEEDRTTNAIVILCGPGNNGGDGLVAARHLWMFGYQNNNITIVYPALRKVKHAHYINLISQCQDLGIPIVESIPEDAISQHSIIIDAIFGFSFRGDPRPPYDTILEQLKSFNNNDKVTTIAVDIPSGWNVDGDDKDDGVSNDQRFMPDVLVSLTAPKLCAQHYKGRHFVGGRFLPPALAQKYNISMPPYPGVSQVMEITSPLISKTTNMDRSWEVEYANYLAQKEMEQQESPNRNEEEQTWEEQYAAYCAEKEAKLQRLDEEQQTQKR